MNGMDRMRDKDTLSSRWNLDEPGLIGLLMRDFEGRLAVVGDKDRPGNNFTNWGECIETV
jgi:hypothetical protein